MTYMVAITEPNSWHMDGSHIIKRDCGHKHRTLSGAVRCAQRLGRAYPDGSWDEWAHYGTIMHTDGTHMTGEELQQVTSLRYGGR